MPKILLKPDAEGNIVIPKEVLMRLGSKEIKLEVGEEGVKLEAMIEPLMGVVPGGKYEVWSPYDADEAALEALEYRKYAKPQ